MRLEANDLGYLSRLLPRLTTRFTQSKDPDLVAELVSSMAYLELHEVRAHRRGIAFLLDSQNSDGTWGDYEGERARLGDYVDQRLYLHTTMVTLRALLESHAGAWLRSGSGE